MKSNASLLFAWLIAPIFLTVAIGSTFAKWRISQIKSNLPRTHDRYSLPKQKIYKKNIQSMEVNRLGDLCVIAGYTAGEECPYWAGERIHEFVTDQHGFQTLGRFQDSDIVFIGDSFLGGNGGDNTSDQVGKIISGITGSKIYEAAHPGDIDTYIKRHELLNQIHDSNTPKKYILMLFEGNDFVMPGMARPSQIHGKPKSFFGNLKQFISNSDLYSLIEISRSSSKAKNGSKSNLRERVITVDINGRHKEIGRAHV